MATVSTEDAFGVSDSTNQTASRQQDRQQQPAGDGITFPRTQDYGFQGGLTGNVLDRVRTIESSNDPQAVGPPVQTAAGTERARGPYQIMPSTADYFGIKDPEALHDERVARPLAETILTRYSNQFAGDVEKGLAAYNAGPGNVRKAIRQGGENWKQYLPQQTQNYLQKTAATSTLEQGIQAADEVAPDATLQDFAITPDTTTGGERRVARGQQDQQPAQQADSGGVVSTEQAFGDDFQPDPGFFEKAGGAFLEGAATPLTSLGEAIGIAQGEVTGQDPRETAAYDISSAAQQYIKDTVGPEAEDEGFWSTKVPRGLGMFAGFLAGGAPARLIKGGAKAVEYGVPAILGSAANSSAQFEQALDQGASLDEAMEASGYGALVGTSESVPIMRALNRLDKGTGGKIKRTLLEGIKGGTEEAAQETFQSVMDNLIASDLVEYDPDRGTFQGTEEGAAVGFTVGGLANTILGLVGGRKFRQAQQRMQAPSPEEPAPTSVQGARQAAEDAQPETQEAASEGATDTQQPAITAETTEQPGGRTFQAREATVPRRVLRTSPEAPGVSAIRGEPFERPETAEDRSVEAFAGVEGAQGAQGDEPEAADAVEPPPVQTGDRDAVTVQQPQRVDADVSGTTPAGPDLVPQQGEGVESVLPPDDLGRQNVAQDVAEATVDEQERRAQLDTGGVQAREAPQGARRAAQRQPFTSELVAMGGLQDPQGEIRRGLGISGRQRPGLINNRRGLDPGDAAAQLADRGFFPGKDRTTADASDVYAALDEELNRGRPQSVPGASDESGDATITADENRRSLEDTADSYGIPPERVQQMDDATLERAVRYEQAVQDPPAQVTDAADARDRANLIAEDRATNLGEDDDVADALNEPGDLTQLLAEVDRQLRAERPAAARGTQGQPAGAQRAQDAAPAQEAGGRESGDDGEGGQADLGRAAGGETAPSGAESRRFTERQVRERQGRQVGTGRAAARGESFQRPEGEQQAAEGENLTDALQRERREFQNNIQKVPSPIKAPMRAAATKAFRQDDPMLFGQAKIEAKNGAQWRQIVSYMTPIVKGRKPQPDYGRVVSRTGSGFRYESPIGTFSAFIEEPNRGSGRYTFLYTANALEREDVVDDVAKGQQPAEPEQQTESTQTEQTDQAESAPRLRFYYPEGEPDGHQFADIPGTNARVRITDAGPANRGERYGMTVIAAPEGAKLGGSGTFPVSGTRRFAKRQEAQQAAREYVQNNMDRIKAASRPTEAEQQTEQTDQGEQRVAPGMERISQREQVERGQQGAKRPDTPQREADEGLFDVQGRGQQDLVEQAQTQNRPAAEPEVLPPANEASQQRTADEARQNAGQARQYKSWQDQSLPMSERISEWARAHSESDWQKMQIESQLTDAASDTVTDPPENILRALDEIFPDSPRAQERQTERAQRGITQKQSARETDTQAAEGEPQSARDMPTAMDPTMERTRIEQGDLSPMPDTTLAAPTDIPSDKALRAYEGSSHTPEVGARLAQRDYVANVKDLYDEMAPWAETAEQQRILMDEIERYKREYVSRMGAMLEAKSRTVSPMIAGPANFPHESNRKKIETVDRRTNEFLNWEKRARKAIRKRLQGAQTQDQEIERKWKKIQREIDARIADVESFYSGKEPGLDPQAFKRSISNQIRTLAKGGQYELVDRALNHIAKRQNELGRTIFQARNKVWNLRDLARQNMAEETEGGAEPGGAETVAEYDGATVYDAPADDRTRIEFDAKPDEQVRQRLKASGWKWSRANGAWQRKRSDNARLSAQTVLDEFFSRQGGPQYAAAYHGTPYDFDQFDISRIGTGEGAQAFGWGLYFAGSEDVARFYRNALGTRELIYNGRRYNNPDDLDNAVLSDLFGGEAENTNLDYAQGAVQAAESFWDKNSFDALQQQYKEFQRGPNPETADYLRGYRDATQALRDGGAQRVQGRVFKVDLTPGEDEYLYWDKPLSEQPDTVRKRLEPLLQPIRERLDQPGTSPEFFMAEELLEDMKGEYIYHNLADDIHGTKRAASLALAEQGIPGIKYLDQQSRRAQEQAEREIPRKQDEAEKLRERVNRLQEQVERMRGNSLSSPRVIERREAEIQEYRDQIAQLEQEIQDAQTGANLTHNYVIFDDRFVEVIEKYARQQQRRGGSVPSTRARDIDPAIKYAIHEELSRLAPGARVRTQQRIQPTDPRAAYASGIPDGGEAAAEYYEGVIRMALDTFASPGEARGYAGHEAIHFLRDMGLFTPQEWAVLQNESQRRWIAENNLPNRPDDPRIVEEGIAYAFQRWRPGASQESGAIQRLFRKIQEALLRIANRLRGMGYQTPEDVFARVQRGEVGRRDGMDSGWVGPRYASSQATLMDTDVVVPTTTIGDVLRDSNKRVMDRLRAAVSRPVLQTTMDGARRYLQDRMLQWYRTQRAVERMIGRPLSQSERVYEAEELYSGRAGERLFRLDKHHKEPLIEQIDAFARDAGVTHEEALGLVDDFLTAKHAPERNAQIAKINPEFGPSEGSGMTDREAAEVMQEADAQGWRDRLEDIHSRVQAMIQEQLQQRVDAGLISEQTAEQWRRTYRNWVPLRGLPDDTDETATEADVQQQVGLRPNQGKGFDVRGPESKRATGRVSRAPDVLSNTFVVAEEAVLRGEKNRVAQSVYNLASKYPDERVWEVNPTRMVRVINDEGLVEQRPMATPQGQEEQDRTLKVKINGEQHRVILHDDRLARSIKNLDADNMGAVTQALAKVNRFLSSMNTGYNPEFVITNAFRDIAEGSINLQQYELDGIATDAIKNYRKALKGAWRGVRGHEHDDEWTEWFREFANQGGRVAFFKIDDLDQQRSNLVRELKLMDGSNASRAKKTFRDVTRFVDDANSAVENAIRLSSYVAARQRGVSKPQAASIAKNLTVNFNRRGEIGPQMNAMYLFYNASVQGTAVMFNALRSKRVRKIAGGIVTTGFAVEMLNAMLQPEDEDGQGVYDKINTWTKSRNLIVMNPWGEDYLQIPLPYGYNVFFDMGRNIAATVRGAPGHSPVKAGGNMLATAVDAFNPVGGTESLLNFLSPTLGDPIVDISQNENFLGDPIMPERLPFGPEGPQSQRYFSTVSPYTEDVTTFLNDITGGNKYRAGAIDISPEVIDHMLKHFGGAAWAFSQRAFNFPERVSSYMRGESDAMTWNEIPFARQVLGEKGVWVDRGAAYDRFAEVEQLKYEVDGLVESGRYQGARDAQRRYANRLALYEYAQSLRDTLRKIRDRKDYIENNYTGAERRRQLDRLEQQEKRLLDQWNRRFLQAQRADSAD